MSRRKRPKGSKPNTVTSPAGRKKANAGNDRSERRAEQQEPLEIASTYEGFFREDISGNFVATPEGKILLCNAAFAQMLSFSSEAQVVQRANLHELFINRERHRNYISQLSTGTQSGIREWELMRRDGKIITVLEKLVGTFDESQKLVQIHGYLSDITSQKLAEVSLRRLAVSLTTAREEERRRIARELHDEAGQSLTALNVRLQMLHQSLGSLMPDGLAAISEVEHLRDLTQATQRKLHDLAHSLHPSALEHLGLTAVLRSSAQKQNETTGAKLILYVAADFPRLEPIAESAVYRITQEAVTNALKHAQAERVSVRLMAGKEMAFVSIRDNGRGFDPARIELHHGIGLTGMRERAEMVRAKLTVHSAPGQGTLVTVLLPLTRNPPRDGVLELYLERSE